MAGASRRAGQEGAVQGRGPHLPADPGGQDVFRRGPSQGSGRRRRHHPGATRRSATPKPARPSPRREKRSLPARVERSERPVAGPGITAHPDHAGRPTGRLPGLASLRLTSLGSDTPRACRHHRPPGLHLSLPPRGHSHAIWLPISWDSPSWTFARALAAGRPGQDEGTDVHTTCLFPRYF